MSTNTSTLLAPNQSKSSGLSPWLIAGISVGVIIFLIIVIVILYFVFGKRKPKPKLAVSPEQALY